MARGQQLDPALVSQLTQNMLDEGNRARKSLGNGVILLALAGGFVAAGYVASGFDADAMHGFVDPRRDPRHRWPSVPAARRSSTTPPSAARPKRFTKSRVEEATGDRGLFFAMQSTSVNRSQLTSFVGASRTLS